jgi:aspartyl-tRNA(Asn)/glutamyl-tRNA(Gln) amidotransferase subunit A
VGGELHRLTLHAAAEGLASGDFTSIELATAFLDRIQSVDGHVGAFLTVTPELALQQAAAADARRANGEVRTLDGLPIAIKDVLSTAGVETTCGSRILEGFIPPYDATVISHLKAAGAVMLGKTNMDEFAMGSSNEHSAYKVVHNPWNLDKVPGGSSGGSAAAVAGHECLAALGSDTGGSVRQPAALCGCVGFKPTYGRVSRYGLIAFASSLDQVGTLTKDTADAALLLGAIAGNDPRDSTSVDAPVLNYSNDLEDGIHDLKIGVAPQYFGKDLDASVGTKVRSAIEILVAAGAEEREISLTHTELALPAYYVIAPSEASANLARYNGVKYGLSDPSASDVDEMMAGVRAEGFGPEVKRRIMLGVFALSSGYYDAFYVRAQKVRTLIKADFDAAFEHVDVIATPTVPTPAFELGSKLDDPVAMYQSDIMTLPASLAGLPCVSVPCGFVDGLPIGLQLIAPAFEEERLFRVAGLFERLRGDLEHPNLQVDSL